MSGPITPARSSVRATPGTRDHARSAPRAVRFRDRASQIRTLRERRRPDVRDLDARLAARDDLDAVAARVARDELGRALEVDIGELVHVEVLAFLVGGALDV